MAGQPTTSNNQVVEIVDDPTQKYIQGGYDADDDTNFLRLIDNNPRLSYLSTRFQVTQVPANPPWVYVRCTTGEFWRYQTTGTHAGKVRFVPLNPLSPEDNVSDPQSYWFKFEEVEGTASPVLYYIVAYNGGTSHYLQNVPSSDFLSMSTGTTNRVEANVVVVADGRGLPDGGKESSAGAPSSTKPKRKSVIILIIIIAVVVALGLIGLAYWWYKRNRTGGMDDDDLTRAGGGDVPQSESSSAPIESVEAELAAQQMMMAQQMGFAPGVPINTFDPRLAGSAPGFDPRLMNTPLPPGIGF